MKITIKVTKEILKKSMMCSPENGFVSQNCAIALAVREIAPDAQVAPNFISWNIAFAPDSPLPVKASSFIFKFDLLVDIPEKRLELPEISFEVDFPDELVEKIGIEEVRNILANSETLSEAV